MKTIACFYVKDMNAHHIFELKTKSLVSEGEQSPRGVLKKGILKNFEKLPGNTYARVSLLIKLQAVACNFIKKQTLAQVFSCEIWGIFKNTFFYRATLLTATVGT